MVALTVAFEAPGLFASASFAVVHVLALLVLGYLGGEGIRVSFLDFINGLLDDVLVTFLVEAVFAAALDAANLAIGKAFAVHLQALRLGAGALFGCFVVGIA